MEVTPDPEGMAALTEHINERVDGLVIDIAIDAQFRAPVLSGELQSTVEPDLQSRPRRVVNGTDHGYYTEVGTGHSPAQPHLRPALNTEREF